MAQSSHRLIAVRILSRVFQRRSTLEKEFQGKAFRSLQPKNRRFTTELVYGTLRRLKTLDFFIERLSDRSIDRIDAAIAWILRISLYQLAWMRVPAHAVVSEAVDLCPAFRKSSAAGFVNAVLRSFSRERPSVPAGDTVREAAVRWSHPEWLVAAYWDQFGRKAANRMMERNNQPPEPWLWINPFRIDRESFLVRLGEEVISFSERPELEGCVRVDSPSFVLHQLYKTGACFFMDPSSQKVARMVPVESGGQVADLCAAPGGKSFILASRNKDRQPIVCADADFGRLMEMGARAELYGIPNLQLVQADASRTLPVTARFDSILLDVPCSGLGTIRRNPDIRWTFEPSQLTRFQRLQGAILREGFRLLRKEGTLIYSTCSTMPQENEQVVARFFSETPAARLEGSFFRSYPNSPDDSFFAARIRRC
ncbi:MAG TPA: 16S rRNA (cytosine(967)-C(5))-methyltransferase RsmB [Acidobacteriota bacterium]|nr:16S rRNA (cytosine(967)-C(5))-methyltransferase RsmB [Acidobacteriota bacterium]